MVVDEFLVRANLVRANVWIVGLMMLLIILDLNTRGSSETGKKDSPV